MDLSNITLTQENNQPTNTSRMAFEARLTTQIVEVIKKIGGQTISNKSPEFQKAFRDGQALAGFVGSHVKSLTTANSAGTRPETTDVFTLLPGAGFYEPHFFNAGKVKGNYKPNWIKRNATTFQVAVSGTPVTAEVSDITTGSLAVVMQKAIVEAFEQVIDQAEDMGSLLSAMRQVLDEAKLERKDELARTAINTVVVSGGGSVTIVPTTLPTYGAAHVGLYKAIMRTGRLGQFSNKRGTVVMMSTGMADKLVNEQASTGEFLLDTGERINTVRLNPNYAEALQNGGLFGTYMGAKLVIDLLMTNSAQFSTTTGVISSLTGGAGSLLVAIPAGNLGYGGGEFEYVSEFRPENDRQAFLESEYTIGAGFSYGVNIFIPSFCTHYVA